MSKWPTSLVLAMVGMIFASSVFFQVTRTPSSTSCVGHAIVQADNAPDCGVAQGVIHGVPVRHGEKQEEEEGKVEKEVERDKEEEKSNSDAHVHG